MDTVDQKVKCSVSQHSAERQSSNEFSNPRFVRRIDGAVKHRPRDSAIHRAGIDVNEAETARELTRHAALSRSGRPVYGDYAMSILCFHFWLSRDEPSFSRDARGSKRPLILPPASLARASP